MIHDTRTMTSNSIMTLCKHRLNLTLEMLNFNIVLGAVHILRQPPEGGGGVSKMLTIADKGGWGQESFQQSEFRGSKFVDSEKN